MALALALKYVAPQALGMAKKELDKYIQDQVERRIVESVLEKTYARMDELIGSIVRRTRIYIILTGIGVIPLIADQLVTVPKVFHLITFLGMSGTVAFMFTQLILNLKRMIQYLIVFEDKIHAEIEAEFLKLRNENWKKKLALWYSGAKAKNYLHLVLAHVVIGFCTWFRANVRHLYGRLVSFFLASFLVGYTAEILLSVWNG